jgi:predicted Zn-dependent protease
MFRPAASLVLLVSGAAAQVDTPPAFDDKPAFRKNSAGPIDSSSHIAGRAEAAASRLAAQIDRFVPLAARPLPHRERYEKGRTLLRERHLAAAAATFDEGAKQYPESDALLAGAAITQFLSGHYDEAAARILELVRRSPRDTRFIVLLGETASAVPARKRSYESALRSYVATFPKLAEPRFYLAQLLAGEAPGPAMAEAIGLWKQAALLDSRDPRPCIELARVSGAQPDEAIRWLKEALARDPGLADAHYRLSRIYANLGDATRAAHHLEQYRQQRQVAR